jgi:putative membrane protein
MEFNMTIVMLVFAGLAGIIHLLFFMLESIWWMRPGVYKTFRLKSEEEALLTRPLAFNQGFYNLFLTLGIGIGLTLAGTGHGRIGFAIVGYVCLFMFGAAMVLLFSNPKMIRGVVLQGFAPFMYLIIYVLKFLGFF